MENKLSENIGNRLKKYRQHSGYSLAELSKLSGVSVSMLSKIENGKSQPPVSTYDNIAKGLGISLSQLFVETDDNDKISVVHGDERQVVARSNYVAFPLSRLITDKKMEPFYCEYPPGKKFAPPNTHDNQEIIYILEGTMEFRYGDELIVLKEGDCVHYRGEVPHSARVLSPGGAKTIMVVSSY